MTSPDIHGQFLWHELETTDPDAARAFYARVLGWKSEAWDKQPAYTVWSSSRGPVGGMMRMPAERRADGGAPRWLSYVGVADLDAAVAAGERLGGRVATQATALPDGGRYAVLEDPQGGMIGLLAPPARPSGQGPASGEFAWHELATPDHKGAFEFYRELFGWEKLAEHDLGAMGSYLIFGHHGRRLGGMFDRPSSLPPSWPHWLPYVRVASARAAAESTAAAGGQVVNGPHEVPGGSWIVQLTDPAGAALAVNQEEPQTAEASSGRPERRPRRAATAGARAESRPPAREGTATGAPGARATGSQSARRKSSASRKSARRKTASRTRAARGSAAARKTARRTAARRKAAGRKAAARKPAGRKAAGRKPAARKTTARKAARRTVARGKAASRRTAARKARRKQPGRGSAGRGSGRRGGRAARRRR